MPSTATADGVQVAYDVEGSGPLLLFVHGITENRTVWDPIVERLRGDFTCARLDLRGHGESGTSNEYDALAAAGDVTAVVEAVGAAEAPVVVGHSLGGIVATAYAAADGSAARAVVNVDQGLRLADFAALVRPLEAELRGPSFRDVYPVVLHSLGFDRIDPATQERLGAIHARAPQDVVLGMWGPLFESTDEQIEALVDGLVAEVRVPYLSLHGLDLGPDYAGWLTTRIPTGTVEVWDGDGHWLHLVEPDRFAARVRDFVAEI